MRRNELSKSSEEKNKSSYWMRRYDMVYYSYIDYIVRAIGQDAKSLLDVGTNKSSYVDWFYWIPERVSLDLRSPYSSESVRGVKADFLTWEPSRKFDVATCLQVLEHVPDADAFAHKLLAVANHVIVSVPYCWPSGRAAGHVHDPVDEGKLAAWMGREPNYSIVVTEPLRRRKAMSRRLIAYYNVIEPTMAPSDNLYKTRIPPISHL